MKIYHLTLFFLVLTDGLLSVRIIGARLKCPSVSIANGSFKIRSKGRIIAYKCSRGFYLLGEPYAACIKGKWDSATPVCLRPGCPRITSLLNGSVYESWRSSLVRFTCDPGYKLIGPSFVYCNGRQWNAAQPKCQAVDIRCDFENKTTCNWVIDDYDDEDFNWRLMQHEPPSRVLKTGPLHDHTLSPNSSGHYLLLETSDYIPSSKPARIHSPVFPQPSDNSSCFIFWYHMYGNTIGTLNVFLNNVLAFRRQGNHGDRWIKGVISLSENVTRSNLQIIIEGSYGGGYTGDIGLDDFSIGNGTDCSIYTVKSCVGRCYEDKNEKAACLCNPECSVDDSCCEDFMEVCSLESTTPIFEASTGVEDSTQVYSDTSGTTYYETSFSETSNSPTELGFTADFESSTGSSSFTYFEDIYSKTDLEQSERTESSNSNDNIYYSPSTNFNIEKDIKSHSTVHNVSLINVHYLSTISYIQRELKSTNSTKEFFIPNRFSSTADIIRQKKERTTFSHPNVTMAVKSLFNSTTVATSSNFNPLIKTISQKATTKAYIEKLFSKFLFKSNTTTEVPQTSTKTVSFNASTNKTLIYNNSREYRNNTTKMPLKIYTIKTNEPDLSKKLTTSKKPLLAQSTTAFYIKKVFKTTPLPYQTSSVTAKPVIRNFFDYIIHKNKQLKTTLNSMTPVRSSTNATLKNLKNITPSFHITTVSPLFNNFTTLSSDQTNLNTSKVINKKIVNDSHTHLQTTSRLPPIFNTASKEPTSFTSIITNTEPFKHYTVDRPKKWKSIYKPKDRFIFSAVQRNKDSDNKTYVILLACTAVIGVISTLMVILFIRRRRRRLVNELEEADTDILYHSSQEMLDLHIARPSR